MTDSSRLTSDTGPFAIVPEWVLDAEISDRAARLYALLARYADGAGESFPSRRRLAARLRCSVKTVDRALDELIDIGAVQVTARYDEVGDRTTNLYRVIRVTGGGVVRVPTPGVTAVPTGGVTGDAVNENQQEREPGEREDTPKSVNRKPTTELERHRARQVLATWNEATGQDLRADDWLAKIIMRIREYPEATLDNHKLIILTALANPWWKGPASPSVVYGNAAQFERSVQAVKQAHRDDNRIERIVQAVNERRSA